MDRKWMYLRRTSTEFLQGVEEFLTAALEYQRKTGSNIRCPCYDCNNTRCPNNISTVKDHVIRRGFTSGYTKWTWHGEEFNYAASSSNVVEVCDSDEIGIENDRIDDMMNDVEDSATKGKKRARGPAKGIKLNPSIQRILQWDYLNRPIGQWANDLKTHCGILARGKISIAIRDWSQVPDGLKETLWLDVQQKFTIPEEKEKKKLVLHTINKCWKAFKYNLSRDFIRNAPPPGKKMPYEAGIVSYEDFESFKAYVNTKNYQEISKKAKMSKARDLHPHYMGATSYAQNEVRWRSEGAYPASASTESATSSASINDVRMINWLKARSKLDAQGQVIVPNKNTRKVKENIEQWQSRVEKGEFVPSRHNDVLNRALERKEHPGRALGLGTNTSIKNAFGTGRHSSSSQTNMIEIGSAAFNEAVQKAVQMALTQMGITSSCQTPHVSIESQAGPKPVDKNKSLSGDVDSLIGLSEFTNAN